MRWHFALAASLMLHALQVGAVDTNPKISIIGQPRVAWTDDPTSAAAERLDLDPGETEIVFDDYLNPYASAYFTLALAEEGLELEEGYFTLFRGLPFGLTLKGGRYRAGFGKLNLAHGHSYPFAERFRVLEAYLPGEEAFVETGVQLSHRLPSPGESSLTVSVDWLQGDSFRIEAPEDADTLDEPRPGVLGRVSGFWPLPDDRSGLELGISAAHGTNNVAARTRSTIFGADLKLKYWNGPQSYLLLQGELLQLRRDDAIWDDVTGYAEERVEPFGFYLYGDYNWSRRWNLGLSYERFELPDGEATDQAFGAFAGLALMEETTVIRLGWEHLASETGSDANAFTLRVIYSLGPHKAHRF